MNGSSPSTLGLHPAVEFRRAIRTAKFSASRQYIILRYRDRDTLRESLSITRVASQILAALTETKTN